MTAALAAPGGDWPALREAASAPYRSAGRMAWGFARGKLGFDPIFRHVLRQGLIAPQSRVLDIGCGQGLIASLLIGANALAARGLWPSGWAAAPRGARVTGIELVPRNIERARAALGLEAATFICGDLRSTPFPAADAIVILDVLHYLALPEQDEVLARVRAALPAGGRLLLRVGDAAAAAGFRLSQWADAAVSLLRGHRAPRRGRTLRAWIARLEALGFEVRSEPMSQGTPFANVLLIAQVRVAG
ncbi:MAG TPA: class I SAM-dependent methyltransferase [Burkholderiaceae bacterium]|jgi:SAM-dependent methyltransferase